MKVSIWKRITVIALVGFTFAAIAAPASANGGNDVTLHRDDSKAVPFVRDVSGSPNGGSTGVVLRRDGSKAVPFVADRQPTQASSGDSFDWRDAGIGAVSGAAIVLLGLAGIRALAGGRSRPRALTHG